MRDDDITIAALEVEITAAATGAGIPANYHKHKYTGATAANLKSEGAKLTLKKGSVYGLRPTTRDGVKSYLVRIAGSANPVRISVAAAKKLLKTSSVHEAATTGTAAKTKPGKANSKPHDTPEVGTKLKAKWSGDGAYHGGKVVAVKEGKVQVEWNDGSGKQWTKLAHLKLPSVKSPKPLKPAAKAAGKVPAKKTPSDKDLGLDTAPKGAPAAVPAKDMPKIANVTFGTFTAPKKPKGLAGFKLKHWQLKVERQPPDGFPTSSLYPEGPVKQGGQSFDFSQSSKPTNYKAAQAASKPNRDKFKKLTRDIEPELTLEEVKALGRYKDSSTVNSVLRKGKSSPDAKLISGAIKRSKPLPADTQVYRGTQIDNKVFDAILKGKVTTYSDKGFMSTSVNPRVASGFMGGGYGGGKDRSVMIRMNLPKGYKVGACNGDTLEEHAKRLKPKPEKKVPPKKGPGYYDDDDYEDHDDYGGYYGENEPEYELLIDAGTQMKIQAVSYDAERGHYIIDMAP